MNISLANKKNEHYYKYDVILRYTYIIFIQMKYCFTHIHIYVKNATPSIIIIFPQILGHLIFVFKVGLTVGVLTFVLLSIIIELYFSRNLVRKEIKLICPINFVIRKLQHFGLMLLCWWTYKYRYVLIECMFSIHSQVCIYSQAVSLYHHHIVVRVSPANSVEFMLFIYALTLRFYDNAQL